jgi:hypothetical protein
MSEALRAWIRRPSLRVGATFLSFLAGCGSGTEATGAADECTAAALGPLCPAGSTPLLSAEAEAACQNSVAGAYNPIDGDASGAVSGACTSHGACRFLCRFDVPCPCGVELVTQDSLRCRADCGGCGDGACADGETPETCPADCAVTCGDGTCDGGESVDDCPEDCGNPCGDGRCEGAESPATCPDDCAATACGDGECRPPEDAASCPRDCGATCGNGTCEAGESVDACPADCGSTCGDGTCEGTETPETCARDCGATCGDGVCADGETPETCARDCGATCGDGVCADGETPETCDRDCGATCGNGLCEAGESVDQCPRDCSETCGDGVCEGAETPETCDRDCGATCGNGTCEPGESAEQCPRDCGATCGNGDCEPGESAEQCPRDCQDACGNGLCLPGESVATCPADCTPACGDGVCGRGESGASCARDCAAACGDRRCEGGETPEGCPFDCGGCIAGEERCNGSDRDVCGVDGDYDLVRCGPDTVCREQPDATTVCLDVGLQICHGIGLCCDGALPRNPWAACDDGNPATVNEVCDLDGQCVDLGPMPENCEVRGDEDQNGLSDCDDPVCAAAATCCVADTCDARGASCGLINDGCGGLVECGGCPEGQTCGGGGEPNACGCSPIACADVFATCGEIDDGCGGTLDCGGCRAPETCGGGGLSNACGVRPCIDGWCYEHPLPAGEDLLDVAGANAADVWAVGAHLHTQHWDGDGWTLHRAPAWTAPDGTIALPTLNGVWVAPGGEAFTVGNLGAVYRWSAGAWHPMASPTELALRGVWGAAADDVWAVGEGGIFHYDGAAWSAALPGFAFSALEGRDATDIWAAGPSGVVAHYDGAWAPVATGLDGGEPRDLALLEDRVVIVGGGWNGDAVQAWDGRDLVEIAGPGFGHLSAAALGNDLVLADAQALRHRVPGNAFGGEWLTTGDVDGEWTRVVAVGDAGEAWAVGRRGLVAHFIGGRWVTNLAHVAGRPAPTANDRLGLVSTFENIQRLVNGRTVLSLFDERSGVPPVALDAQGRLVATSGGQLLREEGGTWRVVGPLPEGVGGAFSHAFATGALWIGGSLRFDGHAWQTVSGQLVAGTADERERWVRDWQAAPEDAGYLLHVVGENAEPARLPQVVADSLALPNRPVALGQIVPCGDGFAAVHWFFGAMGAEMYVLRAASGSDTWETVTRIEGALGAPDIGCTPDGRIYVVQPRDTTVFRVDPDGRVTRLSFWEQITGLNKGPTTLHGQIHPLPAVDLTPPTPRPVVAAGRWRMSEFVGLSPGGRADFIVDSHLFRLGDSGVEHRGDTGGWIGYPYSFAYLTEDDLVCEGFSFVDGRGNPGTGCNDGSLTATPAGDVYCTRDDALTRYTPFGWQAATDALHGPVQALADGRVLGACETGYCAWDGNQAAPVPGSDGLGWPRGWALAADGRTGFVLGTGSNDAMARIRAFGPAGIEPFATPPFDAGAIALDRGDRLWILGENEDRDLLAVEDPLEDLPTFESDGHTFGLTGFPTGLRLVSNGRGTLGLVSFDTILVHP